jgi:hypothetical protein
MPEKIAARRNPVDERIPPEPEPMQEKKAARYNPSDRRIRPQAGSIHHYVHIHEIHANVKGVARRKEGYQSEANEGRYPPLPPPSCSPSWIFGMLSC